MLRLREAAAREDNLARPLDDLTTLHVALVSGLHGLVAPGTVDAVIAHPPHTEQALPMFSDLAAFAAHALKPTGVMVVVGSGTLLPWMLERLKHPELRWIVEVDLLFRGPTARSGTPHRVNLHRRPLLVYGKSGFRPDGMDDLIEVPASYELSPGQDRNEAAMELVEERFSRPGQVVCDPIMLDRSGTALAARRLGCTFIGAERIASFVQRIGNQLVEAEGDLDH